MECVNVAQTEDMRHMLAYVGKVVNIVTGERRGM